MLRFLIDETVEVPGVARASAAGTGFQLRGLPAAQRLMNLIDMMTSAHDKDVIEAFDEFAVRLPALGYGTIELGMSVQRREALVAAGREKGPPPSKDEQRATNADRVAARILER